MSDNWYPLATKDEMQNSGGFFNGYQWKGVLHTTEGSTYAGARAAYLKGVAPHFTVSFEGGKFQVWQHVPLDKASRALRHPAGTPETNRGRAIQVEIVARAATADTLQREYLNGLGKLMRWIEANTGISRSALDFKSDKEGIILARETSPIRLSAANWINFNGWCGHQHVPFNDHWDPGDIDINYLMSVDIGVRPVIDPPFDFNNVVRIRQDRYTDQGVYILQDDGAVFGWEGAVYYGGANGQNFFTNRRAADLMYPDEVKAKFGGDWSQYKYLIVATSGELYGFGAP